MAENPQRILQVSYVMEREGVQNLIMNLYRKLDRSQFQFDFLINPNEDQYKGAFDSEIRDLGGRVFHAPRFSDNPFAYKRFCDHLFSSHPEWKVIHGHFLRSAAATYMNSARKHGKYVIAHSHNTQDQGNPLKNIAIRCMRFPVRFSADYYMACSQAAGRFAFGGRIVGSNRFQVLNNGIDATKLCCSNVEHMRAKERLGLDVNTPVYGHVGRYNEQKNHEFLVDVFEKIHHVQPHAKLIMLGDGPDFQTIRRKVEQLGLVENVIMPGSVSDVDVHLKAFDVFVFPSLYEGLPLAGIEAQAAGVYCLFSDTIDEKVMCTPWSKRIALECGAEKWAEEAISMYECASDGAVAREAGADYVRLAGYDINDATRMICERYRMAAASVDMKEREVFRR